MSELHSWQKQMLTDWHFGGVDLAVGMGKTKVVFLDYETKVPNPYLPLQSWAYAQMIGRGTRLSEKPRKPRQLKLFKETE